MRYVLGDDEKKTPMGKRNIGKFNTDSVKVMSKKEHAELHRQNLRSALAKTPNPLLLAEEFRIPNWGLAGENYVRVKPNARGYRPQRRDEYADDRVFPIVAIPKSTTILQLENLHGWAKGWTAPETFRITKYRHLYAEQLRVKPQYMKNLKKEVAKLHGFFLVEKKEAKA